MKLHRVDRTRRSIQWVMAAVTVAIGVQFTLWVLPHLAGERPSVARPPGVEAFLPIDGMMGLRHLLHTGLVDPIHPAGLGIFIGICLMSVVVAKSFCSHICPVGLLSELLGRLGIRLVGRTLTPPKWLDIPVRGLKYLLFGFFAYAVWFAMSPNEVASFLESPYAKIVDAKMWAFFAPPSRLTVAVIGVLIVASVFIRDVWCRYLCPYGALVGLLGRFAPLKVTRDPELCTDCEACTKVCPARLPVHGMKRVASAECTSCQDCVVACPVEGCLAVRPPLKAGRSRWLRPAAASLVAIGIYLVVVGGFRLTGHWHTSVTEDEFHRRLQEMDSPLYTHVGGQAMSEEEL
ncbi:MAG: 4Fe-4S binding protein [Thermoanaerobaculales bacterium]|jgi:ferredoxin|nr:4Fe-4S binding protein [Thermoanaerobaculales bacterium]